MNLKRYTIAEFIDCFGCGKEMLVVKVLSGINFTKKTFVFCPECSLDEEVQKKATLRYGDLKKKKLDKEKK